MLKPFDWLRQAATGAELLATLDCLSSDPSALEGDGPGPPLSALDGPCERCMVHRRVENTRTCAPCRAILRRRPRFRYTSRDVLLVWVRCNRLPQFLSRHGHGPGHADLSPGGHTGVFVLDGQRFLQVLARKNLHEWLHDLLLYDGGSLTGLIQLFPTNSARQGLTMNDLFCHVIHRESSTAMDQLSVRFYAEPYQVRRPQQLDREGLLTFEAGNFLGILEMAKIFRRVLYPREQDILRELLTTDDVNEEQFYWGRFLGMLSPEARDMLHGWQIRTWTKTQVQLFYELLNHVLVDFKPKTGDEQEPAHDPD